MRKFQAIAVLTAMAVFAQGCSTISNTAHSIVGGVVGAGVKTVDSAVKSLVPFANSASNTHRTLSSSTTYSGKTTQSVSSASNSKGGSRSTMKQRHKKRVDNRKTRRTTRKNKLKEKKTHYEQKRYENKFNDHGTKSWYK